MIQDLLGAVASTTAYRRFAGQRALRTAGYIAFLGFLFTVGSAVSLRLKVTPLLNETFEWLERSVPVLTFSGGKVTSAASAPIRLAHPSLPDVALMIDTQRAEPVTLANMRDAKVLAYLTNNTLYVEQQPGELRSYDLSKAGLDKPVVVDAAFFREASRVLRAMLYPTVLLAIFAAFAAATAIAGVIYALLGLMIASIQGVSLSFGSLFQIAVHAQSASTLVRILLGLAPRPVPLSGLVLGFATLAYTWAGIKACGEAAAAPSAPQA